MIKQLVKIDQEIDNLRGQKRDAVNQWDNFIRTKEAEADALRDSIAADMVKNGVLTDLVEDELTNIKVTFTKTKQIIITDEKAVPEHYLRIKQEINKSLINEDVKELVASNQPLPNWVAIEETPPKLVYRFIKK